MANYIDSIYSTLHRVSDSQFLVVKGSRGKGYFFEASSIYNAEVACYTKKKFKEFFSDHRVDNMVNQYDALNKKIIREIFVRIAVFNESGPPFFFPDMEEFKKIFLNKNPSEDHFKVDKAKTCGKGFKGACEKLYLQWDYFFKTKQTNDPIKIKIREAEYLTSRGADREFQEGEYIWLGEGQIFCVSKIFVKKGAYISILQNVSNPIEAKLVCRGTSIHWQGAGGFHTMLNNIQYEIGNGGTQAVWPLLREFIIQEELKKVTVLGKSLGGAHAQRISVLILYQLPECELVGLTTVHSTGVGKEAEVLFSDFFLKNPEYPEIKLTVIRNGGDEPEEADYASSVGGEHLGSKTCAKNLALDLYYTHPHTAQIFPPEKNLNLIRGFFLLFTSLFKTHRRQTTLGDFFYHFYKDKTAIQSELKSGINLECARRAIAYRQSQSFSSFVLKRPLQKNSIINQKVVVVVGAIFFALCFSGFISCLILHPGSVVFRGSGIILTVPAVVVAGGSVLGLIAIAIGSCSWWLSLRPSPSFS